MKPEELFELADQIQGSASGYKTMEAWLLHMEEYGEQLKQQGPEPGRTGFELCGTHDDAQLQGPGVSGALHHGRQ